MCVYETTGGFIRPACVGLVGGLVDQGRSSVDILNEIYDTTATFLLLPSFAHPACELFWIYISYFADLSFEVGNLECQGYVSSNAH
jgi:hypothetical protein